METSTSESTKASSVDDSDLEELKGMFFQDHYFVYLYRAQPLLPTDAASKVFPEASAVKDETVHDHEHFHTLEHSDSQGHIHTHLMHEDSKPVESRPEIPSKQLHDGQSHVEGDAPLTPFLSHKVSGVSKWKPERKLLLNTNRISLTGRTIAIIMMTCLKK